MSFIKPNTETENYIKSTFSYNPSTGEIFAKGVLCNSRSTQDYIRISIRKRLYNAHRVAWFLYYGTWPNVIDHINGIVYDNRIDNLRSVTYRENSQNQKRHRDGKLVGASYTSANDRWMSRIYIEGVITYLGMFATEDEAHKKYKEAVRELEAGLPVTIERKPSKNNTWCYDFGNKNRIVVVHPEQGRIAVNVAKDVPVEEVQKDLMLIGRDSQYYIRNKRPYAVYPNHNTWRIQVKTPEGYYRANFPTEEDAILGRDLYMKKHNIPMPLYCT